MVSGGRFAINPNCKSQLRQYNLTGQFNTGCFESMFASEIPLNCPTNFLDIELMYCFRASIFFYE